MAAATESLEVVQQRLTALSAQIKQETAAMQGQFEPANAEIAKTSIRPRKSDISVGQVALLWTPWRTGADGMAEPAY